ncbi:MAG TPA: hypothetical protein ENK57_26450 [Polyangiaceae bacterium]|nr:hypothetical protein [Polyangiaceae bacterium]
MQACRLDVNEFAQFIGPRLNKGKPWTQYPIHERFHEIAEDNDFAAIMSHPESGKTTQLAIIRTIWELGDDPDLRFAIGSYKADSKGTAAKIALAIRTLIEASPEVAEVFPDLVPGGKWEESLFTVRRGSFSKDPSVQVVGAGGTITGSRVDRVIFDDALVLANTSTDTERDKFSKWFEGSIIDRLADGGKILFLCNAWHPKDYVHTRERDPEKVWRVERFPIYEPGTKAIAFPEVWTEERLAKMRATMSPLEFARAFLCRARDDGESPFDKKAIERAFEIGLEYDFVDRVDPAELAVVGGGIFTGVDLAHRKKKGSHLSALSTVMGWPEDGTRQMLWLQSGRWNAEEIALRILEHNERYHPIFIVENNAAQQWIFNIVELTAKRLYLEARARGEDPPPIDLPIMIPFTTGRSKADPVFGVEGVAAEISANRWIFPTHGHCKDEVLELRTDMEFYTRGAHVGDRLMATWFAREGIRKGIRANDRDEELTGGVQIYWHDDAGDDAGAEVGVFERLFRDKGGEENRAGA